VVKRVFDVVVAVVGLALFAPVLAAVAMAIKIDSPGPALYRGVRTGRFGRPFRMYKFRTMVVDADKCGGTSTGKGDPRVTRVGAVLRRYKLDELPQLCNVLRGEMSIVGPRPEVEEYTRLYDARERVILSVRPGITDYASIRFRHLDEELGSFDVDRVYAETVRPVKNRLRIAYVERQSFLEDLKLIGLTVARIVRR
jgi:lipopolysaccharide/colanic/teichoic acid biosynthesis glycosyltransferase